MTLFADDYAWLTPGKLKIKPNSRATGIAYASDGSAVRYTWDTTRPNYCFATLTAGGLPPRSFELTFQQTAYGYRFYFVVDGLRALKAFFIPHIGFVTRSEANLQVKGKYMSPRRRMEETRKRWVKKILKYHERPAQVRIAKLEARAEALAKALSEGRNRLREKV
jgi:hypothetical protein